MAGKQTPLREITPECGSKSPISPALVISSLGLESAIVKGFNKVLQKI